MNPRKKHSIGRRHDASGLSSDAELRVMTLQDVADYLHCHYSTVYRLCQQRGIPGFRLGGGNWRFLKSDIDQWIAKGGGRPSGRAPATGDGRRGRKPMSKMKRS